MQQTFGITAKSREILAQHLDNYTLGQLNKVPHGFNNNLIWNIGHIVVVQQMLIYNLSGLPMLVSPEMIDRYKRGTKPERDVTQAEVDEIRGLLFQAIEKTESDFDAGIFRDYRPYTTVTGFELKSAGDAISFNNYHEAMHIGMMMSIRKFV